MQTGHGWTSGAPAASTGAPVVVRRAHLASSGLIGTRGTGCGVPARNALVVPRDGVSQVAWEGLLRVSRVEHVVLAGGLGVLVVRLGLAVGELLLLLLVVMRLLLH